MRARLFLGFLTALAPLLAAGTALAQPAQPLDRLLPQIRRDYPGRFLDAEGANQAGSPHYHLKWLTPDGRVIWLDTDARTGRVLRQSPGRDSFDGPRGPAESEAPPPGYGQRFNGRESYPSYGRGGGYGPPAAGRFNGGGFGNRGFGGGGGRSRGGR